MNPIKTVVAQPVLSPACSKVARDTKHLQNIQEHIKNVTTYRDRNFIRLSLSPTTDLTELLELEKDVDLALLSEGMKAMVSSYQTVVDAFTHQVEKAASKGKDTKEWKDALFAQLVQTKAKHYWSAPLYSVYHGKSESVEAFFENAMKKSPNRKSMLDRVRTEAQRLARQS